MRPRALTLHASSLTPRSGVTLIELLIVVAIIGIVAGLVLGVGAVAAETARQARTRSLVQRIHTLLIDHYDDYRNRRVTLSIAAEAAIGSRSGQLRGQLTAEARLHALREVLLMELPERWSDILLNSVPTNLSLVNTETTGAATAFNEPLYAQRRTNLGRLFGRRLQAVANGTNSITGNQNTRAELLANQSAECLYLIITLATGDGEAAGLFAQQDVGDVDGDGAPEFLDAWGNPIRFLRWAPGADSPAQLSATRLRQLRTDVQRQNPGFSAAQLDQAVADAVVENRDPFDLFRIQQYTAADSALLVDSMPENDADGAFGFRLLPYIYSIGGDEESGIVDSESLPDPDPDPDPTDVDSGYLAWSGQGQSLVPNGTADAFGYRFPSVLNPYRRLTTNDVAAATDPAVNLQIGATLDRDASTDNLTNHLLTAN